jgi:hydrogenase/urease accessory protein HupE
MNRKFILPALCGCLFWLIPGDAEAHLVETSCGPFYNGLCHPFVTPADLLIVLSLALLAGSAGPAVGRMLLFSLTLSWLAGSVWGHGWLDRSFALPVAVSAAVSLVAALLLAANVRCPKMLLGLLGVAAGLGLGLANGVEFRSVNGGALALAGTVTCVFIVTTWVSALAVKNDHGWQRVVVRVAGSWIAAASLLMIGWELRK